MKTEQNEQEETKRQPSEMDVLRSFTSFWVLLLQPHGTLINSLKLPRAPASQGLLLPTRTGQAGASWEPESCHSWGAGKKTGGVRQPQTGWDKQAT